MGDLQSDSEGAGSSLDPDKSEGVMALESHCWLLWTRSPSYALETPSLEIGRASPGPGVPSIQAGRDNSLSVDLITNKNYMQASHLQTSEK